MSKLLAEQKGCTTIVGNDEAVHLHYINAQTYNEFTIFYEKETNPNHLNLVIEGVMEDGERKQITWTFDPYALIESITKIVRASKQINQESFL
jgi:hypothetical protein